MSNSWLDYSTTSNLFKQSYIKDFIDVSGDLYVRNHNINGISSDISMNGTVTCNSITITGAVTGINTDVQTELDAKQNILTTATGISIDAYNTISSSGGGGGAPTDISTNSTTSTTPWVQLGNTITQNQTGISPATVYSQNGWFNSAMISGDGSTLLLGCPLVDPFSSVNTNAGALYVYRLNASNVWTTMGNLNSSSYPLVGIENENIGMYQEHLAINSDGSIIAFGPNKASPDGTHGYVKVFSISSSGVITQRGSTMTGSWNGDWSSNDNYMWLGKSVKISSDGDRIIASAPRIYPWPYAGNNNKAKIRIYDWDGSDYQLHSMISIEGEGADPGKISINDAGTRIALGMSVFRQSGGPDYTGAARVYEWNEGTSTWDTMGADIIGVQQYNARCFGGVALSGNGNILITNERASSSGGHTNKIFIYDGTNWVRRGDNVGGSVVRDSLNYDGTIVANYTSRRARAYKYDGSSWNQIGGGTAFGTTRTSVDITDNGDMVVVCDREESPDTMHVSKLETLTTVDTNVTSDTIVTQNVDVSGGDIIVSGSTVHSSDVRLKSEITALTSVLEMILKLEPKKYNKESERGTSIIDTGFIAQKIWYKIPELRHLIQFPEDINPSNIKDISDNILEPEPKTIDISANEFIDYNLMQIIGVVDGEQTTRDIPDTQISKPNYEEYGWGTEPVGINYEGLISYLVGAIQELKTKIEGQTAEINNLTEQF